MRRRLLRILQRLVPGTDSWGRKLLNLLRGLLIGLLKLLRWVAPIVIGVVAIWIIGGNLLATQQEKRVEQARQRYIQEFHSIEPNNSALKLEELGAGLGVGSIGIKTTPTRHLHLPASKTDQKWLENFRKVLSQYLDSQLDKPNDDIDIPPENIRQYLADHAAELEAIRTHVLTSELPRWELGYDIGAVGDIAVNLPAFLNQANFQKLLAVDILDKTRQGQSQAALRTLDVSWKLNQSLLERPEFIAQLVVIINSRFQAGVIRKMQGLPIEWQDRLSRFNQSEPQAFLKGLYSEAFFGVSARKYSAIPLLQALQSRDSPAMPQWLIVLSDPFLKPYVRLFAVGRFDYMQQLLLKLPEQDFCTFNPEEFEKQLGRRSMWSIDFGPWSGQWRKVGKVVLRFELTQKVLQVKELAQQQGRLPKQLPGIESSVCRDAKWIYQLFPDGTASISFSKELEWMKSEGKYQPGDRLTYSFKPKKASST